MAYLKPVLLFVVGWGAIACGTDMLIEALTLETWFYVLQAIMSVCAGLYCCGRSGWVFADRQREMRRRNSLGRY